MEPDDRIEDMAEVVISGDAELRRMLGLYDAPAFARRGHELEHALARLRARCTHDRITLLEMPLIRINQWSRLAVGPDDWHDQFVAPFPALWNDPLLAPPRWAEQPGSVRQRRAAAQALTQALTRFNRRWSTYLNSLNLAPINHSIELYNRYYVLEKECSLGSARLAARNFQPVPPLTVERLLIEFPPLPVPILLGGSASPDGRP